MKTLILALLLLSSVTVLAQTAPVQTRSNDLPGWQDTRWGMTLDEVLKVVAPIKLEKRSYLSRGGEDGKPFDRYGYADYYTTVQVLGDDYKVRFYMDVKTDRLMQVTLEPAKYGSKDYIPEAAFTQLSEALTQKYGAPTNKEDDRSRSAYSRNEQPSLTRQWVFPTTSIRLHYLALKDVEIYSLSITYLPSKSRGVDAL